MYARMYGYGTYKNNNSTGTFAQSAAIHFHLQYKKKNKKKMKMNNYRWMDGTHSAALARPDSARTVHYAMTQCGLWSVSEAFLCAHATCVHRTTYANMHKYVFSRYEK